MIHKAKTETLHLVNPVKFFTALFFVSALIPSSLFAVTKTETFTSSGTSPWTCPPGVTSVVVECWGGGGAGGGNNGTSNGGGGGGGGAYAKQSYTVSGGNTYAYSIGAAGQGAANADGGNGGDTYWINGTTIMAKGGSGGKSNANGKAGGAGGLASASYGTTAKFDGGWGETGRSHATGRGGWGGSSAGTGSDGFNNGDTATYSSNTYPTASTPAGGGHGGDGGSAGGSAPASGNGGGGGGSGEGTNVSGGNGAAGKIIITYDVPCDLNIYYSVGTTATALYSDNASATGGVMTLASSAATNIGLGDEVRVGSNRYYIRLRESATSFRLENSAANSGTPGDTAVTFTSQAITIYRAFNALDDAVDALDGGVCASDANHLNTANLTTNNNILHIVCYGDGIESGNAVVDGWTTGASNYLRIFTPTSSTEVGISQRHDGKLDSTSAYLLRCGTANTNLVAINDAYVRVDGIQIDAYKSGNTGINGFPITAGGTCDVRISNCILKGPLVASTGIGVEGGTGTVYAINNIIYDWKHASGAYGIGFWSSAATCYAYNNTIYNCQGGFSNNNSAVAELKNNLVYSCVDNYLQYSGTYNGDYNLSGPADDANMPGANSVYGTITFADAANFDFHLVSGDANAIDDGTDLSGTFTTDIDGITRPGTWDIGADEYYAPAEKDLNIYYSVGTNTSALYSGNAAVVAKGILDLASNAGNDVGVGDEVRVGSSRYYIRSRIAADSFRIENSSANSGTPGDTNITFASTAITIYRAFNSLSAAEAGASGANYLNTANLTTNSNILHFACYGDGVDNTAVTVDGYTTSATSYIRIFTPTGSTEVGTTQRHAGKWNTSKYYLSVSNATPLYVQDNHVRVDGLQVLMTLSSSSNIGAITCYGDGTTTSPMDFRVSNNIIRASISGGQTGAVGISPGVWATSSPCSIRVWNNIVYDMNVTGGYGVLQSGGVMWAYNNTVYNCTYGIGNNANITLTVAKNNITQKCGNGFDGTMTESYNVTDLAEGLAGTGSKNSTTVLFADSVNDDFHLSTNDAQAKSSGTNLSADGNLPITDDIDGASRTVTWCIGADENDQTAEKDANIYYSVGTNAAALYTGDAAAVAKGLLDLASGADNSVGVGDEVRVGSNRYYIRARIAADSFRIENSAANGGTPGDTNITFASQSITIYRAFNSLRGAIDVTNGNADDANHLNTTNLTSGSGHILHIACYGDGADTDTCRIDGWTTGASNYIRIFTPTAATEVGTTQRHDGKWKTSGAYILDLPLAEKNALATAEDFVRVEGLQIDASGLTGTIVRGFRSEASASGDVRVSACIIRGSTPNCNGSGIKSENGTLRAWNNILCNNGAGIQITTGTAYVYNNTVWGGYNGLKQDGGTFVAKNNLVYKDATTDNYVGTFDAAGTNNLSGPTTVTDAQMPSTNKRDGVDVTFVNAGSADFHLSGSDAGARTYGTDLSADGNLAFTTDIDGLTRSGTWDIGADEVPTDVTAPTNVGLSSPANGATGVSTTPTLTVLTATDADAGLHATPYYIELATNTSFTTGTQNSGWQSGTTWAPTLSGGTTYYWRVKARDAISNTSSLCGFTADAAGYGSFTTQLGAGTYSTYSYFDTLYFNTTSTGANVPDAVSNFPVLVRFTNATFPFSQAQGDGDDIRFLDADGSTTLSHERERYDSTNGVAEFWVLVPSVSGNSTSDFIIRFWGNSGASTASSPENTFQTTNGFVCVMHLGESGDNTGKDYIDATSNSNDGAGADNALAADVPTQGTGIIGKGQVYDATDYIRVADNASLNTQTPTMSAWLKPNPTIATMGFDYPHIGGHDNYSSSRGIDLGDDVTGLGNTIHFRVNGATGQSYIASLTVADNTQWVYLTGKYTGSAVKAYRNAGVSASDSSTVSYTTTISYANDPMTLGWLVGSLDEFRLESVARSAQWIRLCYENQRADQTLIRYSLKTLYYSVGTTATAMYSDNASASNGVLTLASAAVDSVGLGDEVRVGSNRYYIRGRSSSTEFRIQNSAANSGIVGDTAITFSSTAVTIYRAFNKLDDAVDAVDGGSCAKDASHANTANLALNNYQLNIVCYADGTDNTAAVVDGWTTSSTNYIRIFTPTATNEVGKSQRHAGVWNTSRYCLSVSNAKALTISDENVRVDGLQVEVASSNGSDQASVYITGATGTCDHRISNSIVKGYTSNTQAYHAGILLYSSGTGTLRAWNNIIYNFGGNGTAGAVYFDDAGYTTYAYNNTVSSSGFGLWVVSGSVVSKNNLVTNITTAAYTYDGTFAAGTDYNATNSTDAIGAGSNNRISQTFTFLAAGTNFHLSGADAGAKDYGTNLSADANLAFTTDIDGETRQGTWDIGADEGPPTYHMYYSVGTRSAALYSGNGYAAGGLLTLSGTGSDTVGVGDEIRVSSNRYYITQRHSNTYYDIQNSAANGGTPGATNITFSEQAITIYRAFPTLDSALEANRAGTANRASDASHLNTTDLTAGNYVLNIACYGDGADITPITNIDGWTTSSTNYIRIFAPSSSSEVGISQRHAGKWDTNKYYKSIASTTSARGIRIRDKDVRVDGLQIRLEGAAGNDVKGVSMGENLTIVYDIRVSNCIIRGDPANTTQDYHSGIEVNNSTAGFTGTLRAWNNIIYDFRKAVTNYGIQANTNGNFTIYAYNNTIYNCGEGLRIDQGNGTGASIVAKNNILQKCNDGIVGNNITETYSVTDLAEGLAGTGSDNSKTVLFVDSNGTPRDLHVQASDVEAKNAGTDLSADTYISFSTDIDGNTRSGTWDIGADEAYTAPKAIYYSVGTTATALYDGTGSATSGALTITTSSASNTIGLGDEVRQGSNEYYISSRSSSTSFGIQTPTGSTAITFADGAITIYRAFNSLNAAEAGASGANYLNTANLVTGGFQLHLACYGDGSDATATTVDGYTTGPDNYIRIFTPTSATEVGATQRHVGTWAASNVYTLAYNGTSQALSIADEYVRVEGLQISITTAAAGGPNGIYLNPGATPSDIRIGYNIIKGVLSASATSAEGIQCNASGTYKIYNNLVYDLTDPSNDHTGIAFGAGAAVTAYVYNNTVQGSNTGISRTVGTIVAKNNLTQTCTDGFSGTFDATSNYNLSDVASDAPGANSKNGATVSFVNAGSDNFHLQATDTVARGCGVDLTVDANLSFTDDIDGKTRYSAWDIGADQYWDEPGLAVTMDAFFAKGGDANDTITWRTQSEKDNYGFNIYRRIKPAFWMAKMKQLSVPASVAPGLPGDSQSQEARGKFWATQAKVGKTPVLSDGSTANRSPLTVNLFKDRFDNDTTWKLVNIKPIPGAKGGRSVGPRNYRIIDYGVENGITYEYTIEDIDYSGVKIRHGVAEATPTKRLPVAFALHPNYPNPFNPMTVIAYDLPKACRVDISVYDLRGRKITTLVSASQVKEAGFYKALWTGKDTYNRPVASGVYLYRIQAGEFVKLRKMTLLK